MLFCFSAHSPKIVAVFLACRAQDPKLFTRVNCFCTRIVIGMPFRVLLRVDEFGSRSSLPGVTRVALLFGGRSWRRGRPQIG